MKTLTVVIVCYNYGHLVANAIDSVIGQTVLPNRILVVDDASFDCACDVAKKYNVEYIQREKNLGTLKNFNDILMNQVNTERVMLLGGDNWLRPDYIEKMNTGQDIVSSDMVITGNDVRSMKIKESYKFYHKDGYWIRKFKPKRPGIPVEVNIRRKNFIHGSSIYNVELARKVGGYEIVGDNKEKRLQEDWGLWKKMIATGATYRHVQEPLLYYRRHTFNFNGTY